MSKKKKNTYIRIATFPVDEIFPLVREEFIYVFKGILEEQEILVPVKMYSQRYFLFRDKGTICQCCGVKGTYFALESHPHQTKKFHFNLYGLDKYNNEVMLTKDHIVPKSRGGKNHQDNYQVLCQHCNRKKSNIMEPNIIEIIKERMNNATEQMVETCS